MGINDGMTEGEYKFDNSPLQVAYTNFAPDAQTNFDGLDEVVYKVNISLELPYVTYGM